MHGNIFFMTYLNTLLLFKPLNIINYEVIHQIGLRSNITIKHW